MPRGWGGSGEDGSGLKEKSSLVCSRNSREAVVSGAE